MKKKNLLNGFLKVFNVWMSPKGSVMSQFICRDGSGELPFFFCFWQYFKVTLKKKVYVFENFFFPFQIYTNTVFAPPYIFR